MTAALRTALAFAAALALAACDTPRPFGRDATGTPDLGAPSDAVTMLCVSAFPGLSPEMSAALQSALADELAGREVLAMPAVPCPQAAPRILAWEAAPAADGIAHLMIARPPKDGRPFAPVALALPADAPDAAPRWAATIANRLAYRAPLQPSARVPFDSASRTDAPPPAETRPQAEKVYVALVDGAGGDGNTLLRFAMIGHLRRGGYQPVVKTGDQAPWAVKGDVEIAEVNGGAAQRIRVTWTVKDAAGKTVGTVSQANTVPARALERGWGRAADAIVAAALPGVADAIESARAARDAAKP